MSGEYRGTLVRQRSFGAVALIDTSFGPKTVVPSHTHQHPYLSFVLRGSYVEDSNGGRLECVPGTVILHPAGETHSDRFDRSGGRLLNVRLDHRWLEDAFGGAAIDGCAIRVSALRAFSAGLQLHLAFDSLSTAAMHEISRAILNEAASQHRRHWPRWMSDALRFIEESLDRGDDVPLPAAAHRAGVHPVHLARSFRRYAGINFSRYLMEGRVLRALGRLLATTDSITDIAAHHGFADHPHLCRSLRSTLGLSPSQLRALLRDVN